MLRALDARSQCEQFVRPRNCIIPVVRLESRGDGLLELVGSFGVITGQLAQAHGGRLRFLRGRRLRPRRHDEGRGHIDQHE